MAERTLLRIGVVSATLGIITFFVAREGFSFTLAQATPWFLCRRGFSCQAGALQDRRRPAQERERPSRRARRGHQEGDRRRLKKRRLVTSPSKSGRPRETS